MRKSSTVTVEVDTDEIISSMTENEQLEFAREILDEQGQMHDFVVEYVSDGLDEESAMDLLTPVVENLVDIDNVRRIIEVAQLRLSELKNPVLPAPESADIPF